MAATEKNGISRQMWLVMATEGGRWTALEVANACGYDTGSANGILQPMSKGGFVERYQPEGKHGRVRFGVTLKCKPPQGLTLGDLAQLGAIPKPARLAP